MSSRKRKPIPSALDCGGCATFECTDDWSLASLQLDESRAELWLKNHLLVWPSVSCAKSPHPETEELCVLKRQRYSIPRPPKSRFWGQLIIFRRLSLTSDDLQKKN